ncbi:MAG: DUF421 domain-containing protein [Clostridia bacterium]|nr:DUF421 domain-containing protein [Clostridia bacterium]
MINGFIRAIIIYIFIIAAIRLMGKRQIGELQPSELVITIILSEVASMPLEDTSTPLIPSVITVFLLASLEVLSSDISVKSPSVRKIIQGNPLLVIKNGRVLQKNIKSVRYSIDDLTAALRLKDIFDIRAVDFAYIETNGGLSVKLKKDYSPPTKSDESSQDGAIPMLIIGDGKIIDREFNNCNMSKEKLLSHLKKQNISVREVFMMTADSTGDYNIIRKQDKC